MSIKINVYNEKGENVGSLDLSEKIFNVAAKDELIHQAVVTQMNNERQVLANTKTRAEVRGGGAKPWKQKGTGRARAGSSRSPLWVGGGVIFGPTKERNFSRKINKKMKQKAMFMVLSNRVADNDFAVLQKMEMKEFKTKIFNSTIKAIEEKVFTEEKKQKRSVLFVNANSNEMIRNSGRNLAGVKVIGLDNINIVDLMKYRNVVITEEAIKKLEETYKN